MLLFDVFLFTCKLLSDCLRFNVDISINLLADVQMHVVQVELNAATLEYRLK